MSDRHPSKQIQVSAPPIIERAGDILSRYDVLFCDVWGVVHDGTRAFPGAVDALRRFRGKGGTVILVSNAPVPKAQVAAMLDSRMVPRDTYDDIVSSGDIALRHIGEEGYRRVFCIGPADRDSALFKQVKAEPTGLDHAEAILCSGLINDRTETAEDYRPLLAKALALSLPFVCANPDLVVDVGGTLYPCAGAIAEIYERMGGGVFWAGKPHASAYGTARVVAEQLRGSPVELSQILAVGDAVRTDLEAARNLGVDAIFVAAGIHREDVFDNGALSAAKVQRLLAPPAPKPIAVMTHLAW